MRTVIFEVPADVIGDFTEKMTDLELDNEILGKNEYDEILIEVSYEKSESVQVDELETYLDELIEAMDDGEQEEDEEESDDK